MKPIFKIVADGTDITAKLQNRNGSIVVTDNAGFDNDLLTIRVSDHEPRVQFPNPGTKFEVWMGYEDTVEARTVGVPVGLRKMGTFTLDGFNWGFSDNGDTLTITAHAADMGSDFKVHRNKSWTSTTIKSVVTEVANKYGYVPKVSPTVQDTVIDKEYQRSESDQAFLTRLATKYGGLMKVAEGVLYFGSRDSDKNVSGKSLTSMAIDRTLISDGDFDSQTKSKYTGVTAKYQVSEEAEVKKVTAGIEGKYKELKEVFGTQDEAEKAAAAALNDLEREGEKLNFSCIGHVGINAERKVILTGFRPGVTTEWLVNSVTHTINDSGFISNVVLELPNGKSGTGSKGKSTVSSSITAKLQQAKASGAYSDN